MKNNKSLRLRLISLLLALSLVLPVVFNVTAFADYAEYVIETEYVVDQDDVILDDLYDVEPVEEIYYVSLEELILPMPTVVYSGWSIPELQNLLNNSDVMLLTNGLGVHGPLTVPEGRTLTIPAGVRFDVHNSLIVEGTLINNGSINNNPGNGTITVAATGRIDNNGFIQNNTGRSIYIYSPGNITGNAVHGSGNIAVIPVLSYTLFAEDWRVSINIRFFFDGVPGEIPLADMELIVDGVEIGNIRDFTQNIAGWQTSTPAVFICKIRNNWEHLTFTATAHGQTLFFEFTNSMFVPPVLTTTVFAEDWRDSINIRFFLDGVLTELPIANIEFIADGEPVQNIRDFTINIAGWQTSTNIIMIGKTGTPWQHMIVRISYRDQVVEHEFVNNMFVPPVEFVGATPTAFVERLNGNQNILHITVIEHFDDGSTVYIHESFIIDNNSDGTFTVGSYNVFVSTRGNIQIREIRIV